MPSPAHLTSHPPADYTGPRIALIHGLLAGRHMERHLLTWLRNAGYADTTLYSNHQPVSSIAADMQQAAEAGRPLVLIGYSQGGFQVVKVARRLAKKGITVDLMISMAAGGAGRLYPPQIGFQVRRIPGNVQRYLNYFAIGDNTGTDPVYRLNLAWPESVSTHLENIAYPPETGVDHFGISRCLPSERVAPAVQTQFLERLLHELSSVLND